MMTGLIDFSQAQSEALVLCLIASLAWAGALFAAARLVERDRGGALSERMWTATLLLAVAPSLLAPMLAHVGVSLRAPEPTFTAAELAAYVAAPASAPVVAEAAPSAPAAAASISAEQAIGLAALVYAYGVAMALAVWIGRSALFSLAVAKAPACTDERLAASLSTWARRYGLARTPQVRRSPHVSSVCVYGVARPVIIAPAAIDARVGRDDLIMMCAHELAHVRRGDTRLFTATALARALFWFNPFVHAIAARIELAAEEGADALVLKAGADRRAYAQCFVEGLKFAALQTQRPLSHAPSFTPQGRDGRRRRLNAILSVDGERSMALSTKLMLGAAAGVALLGALGQAAYAVDPDAAAQKRRAMAEAKAPPAPAAAQEPQSLIIAPVAGEHTAAFGKTVADPASGALRTHSGVDIKAAKGARVVAAGDGVVVEATDRFSNNVDWGKVVVIDHGHGLITRYAHLDSYSVRKGDRVKAGEQIAKVGATGKVTGPHLHFEALKNGKPVDPVAAIAPVPAVAPVPAPTPEPFGFHEPEGVDAFAWVDAPDAPDAPAIVFAAPEDFGFAFASAPTAPTAPSFDLADALDDILEGRHDGAYDLTLSVNGETVKLSDKTSLSDEDREKLRGMLAKLREDARESRVHARVAIREAERAADERRMVVRIARDRNAIDGASPAPDARAFERDIAVIELDAIEMELEALANARADLPVDFDDALNDAIADLEDARADILDDENLSAAERDAALAGLEQARAQMRRDRSEQRRSLSEQMRDIERSIEALERRRNALAAQIEAGE